MRANRPHLTPREIGILVGAILGGAVVLAALIAANTRLSGLLPGGGGLYSIWTAAREFVFEHGDPYSPGAAALAQQLAYGKAASPPQNPYRLDLPFFLMLLYLPVGLIAEPAVARGVWASLAQMAIVGASLVSLRLVDWHPPRTSLWAICLIVMLSYPAVAALVEGSLVPLLLLVYVSILWAMHTRNDELAGALAVVALCKWEVGLPFLIVLATRALQERRWRMAAGFGMALVILLVVSFLLFPGWLMPFLIAAVAMMRSGHGVSSQSALRELVPDAAAQATLVIAALVGALLLLEFLGAKGSEDRRFNWAAFLALAATPLLGPRSEVANLVMLIPGMVMIVAGGSQRPHHGAWISWSLLGVLFVAPWILILALPTSRLDFAANPIFVLLPAGCLIGMYWTRWWFLRPARTWLDEVRESR